MKLPNGYGTVYKLSGNRRRPWIARKTIGWSEEGKQLYYTIGYFKTRAEAMAALAEYNKNPIGERGDITLEELYNEWKEEKYPKLSKGTIDSYNAAWKYLSQLKDIEIKMIKTSHIQKIVDDMFKEGLSKSSCHKVKVLASLLYKKAMADDIIDKNYAELVELPTEEKKEKEIFTDMEIKAISDLAKTDEWANTIMILIYTGMRISEMLKLTKFNVVLDNMIIRGGVKTDAGKNRIIPIHSKIQGYIKYWYNKEGEYLITKQGQRILTKYYRENLYYPTLEKAGVRRLTPHSCRHTFASLLDRAGADTKSIQEIIGHADYATTANIYTHPDIEKLRNAIEKI